MPRGHTASHARHVTHDTDTEHGTRFPGWGITKDPFSQPPTFGKGTALVLATSGSEWPRCWTRQIAGSKNWLP